MMRATRENRVAVSMLGEVLENISVPHFCVLFSNAFPVRIVLQFWPGQQPNSLQQPIRSGDKYSLANLR